MALELLAGAFIGAAVAELIGAVKDVGEKISSFKPMLKSIESTLTTITPRLDEIVDQSGSGIDDLRALIRDGKELVHKCSTVHRFDYVNKARYSKMLLDFDKELLRYFETVLQLDQLKDGRETLRLLKQLHSELIPDIKAEILGEIEKLVQPYNGLENVSVELEEIQKSLIILKEIMEEIIKEMKDDAEGSSSRIRRDDQAYREEPVITREDRAREALSTIWADKKKENVMKYVDNFKKQFGNGVSTKCIVYNATGDAVSLVGTHDWFGNIGPAHYPSEIANGQWGGFLHVKVVGPPEGSVGAVVYRGKNLKDEDCDWMLSWSNPWLRLFGQDNHVYTEIREARHYEQNHWGNINRLLDRSGKNHKDIWNGCSSSITTGTGTTVVVEVILTQENA